MANTKPKDKILQIRYLEGDDFSQILLNKAKKDRLYRSGKPNLSEASRRTVLEHPVIKQKNKDLTDTVDLLRSSGIETTLFSFPNCPDSHILPKEPSKRRCSRKKEERWVDLPKFKGIFIVDDPSLCEICQAREKCWVELNIMGGKKKVSRKDVFLVEAKKRYYQDDEQEAVTNDETFRKDETLRKARERQQNLLHEKQQRGNETIAEQKKTKKKMRDGRKSHNRRDNSYRGQPQVNFPYELLFDYS